MPFVARADTLKGHATYIDMCMGENVVRVMKWNVRLHFKFVYADFNYLCTKEWLELFNA